ncbi:MAG TPA: magnesium-translocating P-type ATPase [Chitinophagaceae bacterium]|nr:magnesium-translocating P-type ATPase [Chitinophagaceae bacterium]
MADVTPKVSQSKPFYSISVPDAFSSLGSGADGLSTDEAGKRLAQYGLNSIKGQSSTSGLKLFLSQFKSPITILLIVASMLSFVLKDPVDAVIILLIVFISSFLGFWQERGAANAIGQLLKMVQMKSRVLRDSKEAEIPAEQIVPGDVILLSAGSVIPGDSLIIESDDLYVDEAAFTGESYPVEKKTGIIEADTAMAGRINSLYMGAHVISGSAKALVFTTGSATEFGKISESLRERSPETDFEKGIKKFGFLLMQITLILVIIIFGANVFLHKPVIDSFLFSLALAVGLTPQLLPAIITVNLARGARNMATKKVIVKKLSAIENFGSMNILCTDKTGTITAGQVKVDNALDLKGDHSDKVLKYAWLNASLQHGFKNPIDEAIIAGYKNDATTYELLSEVPYDFIRKRLSIQVQLDADNIAITKGALQQVLDVCSFAETADGTVVPIADQKNGILTSYEKLSGSGFRTLGVAWKKCEGGLLFDRPDEKDMVFMGFITLFDPLKEEVSQTIKELNDLGIELKIITGDNALVAKSLATQVGFPDAEILKGDDIRKMSTAAFIQKVKDVHIFAEVEPNQKESIIIALKKSGNVVGFMGDGINDASAIHAADVGISVNTAVDVAREAADLVLLDQDLRVLKDGVLEGRKTFANTMKYIFMATSANFGNMFSMAGASLFLPFLPLLPKQILLTNLLTDLPQTTISKDKVDEESILKPHPWDIRFIKHFMVSFGILSSVFDYLTFGVLIWLLHAHEAEFQTGWFTESVISASLIVLVVRTKMPFFKRLPSRLLTLATLAVVAIVLILPFTPLGPLFNFVPLPGMFYLWMLLIVIGYVISCEILKHFFYRKWKQY